MTLKKALKESTQKRRRQRLLVEHFQGQVQAFEAQLSEYFGGRPVRTFNSGTCTMEISEA